MTTTLEKLAEKFSKIVYTGLAYTGTIALGILLSRSCLHQSESNHQSMRHYGNFEGFPVRIESTDSTRSIEISTEYSNRGYIPAKLTGRDVDTTRFGFEYSGMEFSPAYDLANGTDSSKIDLLKKFEDPIELERIFAYVNADQGQK